MTGRDERGFSLIELVVTVGLIGIVLAVMLNFLDNTTKVTSRAANDVRADQDGQLALRTATEDIRSASAGTLVPCAPGTWATCLTVSIAKSTLAKPCPKRVVTYSVVGTSFQQALTDYAADCTTVTKSSTRALMTRVTNTTGIFTYYQSDGITPFDLAVATDADIALTRAVKILLAVQYQANSPVLSLSSVASLRNNRS